MIDSRSKRSNRFVMFSIVSFRTSFNPNPSCGTHVSCNLIPPHEITGIIKFVLRIASRHFYHARVSFSLSLSVKSTHNSNHTLPLEYNKISNFIYLKNLKTLQRETQTQKLKNQRTVSSFSKSPNRTNNHWIITTQHHIT